MKRFSRTAFGRLLRKIRHGTGPAFRYGRDALARMSLGQLLVSCIVLALAITILPLAIGLFAVLLLLKLMIALVLIRTARLRRLLPDHGSREDDPS